MWLPRSIGKSGSPPPGSRGRDGAEQPHLPPGGHLPGDGRYQARLSTLLTSKDPQRPPVHSGERGVNDGVPQIATEAPLQRRRPGSDRSCPPVRVRSGRDTGRVSALRQASWRPFGVAGGPATQLASATQLDAHQSLYPVGTGPGRHAYRAELAAGVAGQPDGSPVPASDVGKRLRHPVGAVNVGISCVDRTPGTARNRWWLSSIAGILISWSIHDRSAV